MAGDDKTATVEPCEALVIGGGPAGLMAAEMLSRAGLGVILAEAKPSVGRKFLMAGKSGLNLTRVEPAETFRARYAEAADWLGPMLDAFGPEAVQDWARGLGQALFVGSTGRVFPEVMKASPLLRAWLARLGGQGVAIRTRWRWRGWDGCDGWGDGCGDGCGDGAVARFDTPQGARAIRARVTVLALGGASWARLGADGAWAGVLAAAGAGLAPFAPANAAVALDWSAHMAPLFGAPLKGVAFRAGAHVSRGEAVISARGLEGGGIYAVSRGLREGAPLVVDLAPDLDRADLHRRLARPRGKTGKISLANHLRRTLKLGPARGALLNEFARPLPADPAELAARIKALELTGARLRPIDEAISTAGGVRREALDPDLMLTCRPGIYCAGEMLDWEAPTGGYLLTACLATGRWAGRAAARRAAAAPG